MPDLTAEEKKLELYAYLCEELEKGQLSEENLYAFTTQYEISNSDVIQTIDEVLIDNRGVTNNPLIERSYTLLEDI